jgi:hypothetical protein
MKRLLSNLALNKGDVITSVEVSKISHGAGTPNQYFEDVTFRHKFEILRVNPKTYTCKYTEGAYAGTGFKWIKTPRIESAKKYYIN